MSMFHQIFSINNDVNSSRQNILSKGTNYTNYKLKFISDGQLT